MSKLTVKFYALIPLILAAALMAVLLALDIKSSILPPLLLPILNTAIIGFICLAGAAVSARSFHMNGSSLLLLMGGGLLAFGLSAILAGWMVIPLGQNVNVTVYNIGIFISGTFFLAAGGTLATEPVSIAAKNRSLILVSGYAGAVLAITVAAVLSVRGLIPEFFIPNEGPTSLRQVVLGFAAGMIMAASLSLFLSYRKLKLEFLYWCSLGLASIFTGLLAALVHNIFGDPMTWLSRAMQYVGTTYFLAGAIALRAEAAAKNMRAEDFVQKFLRDSKGNYQLLVETSPDAIISLDSAGTILMWNHTAEKMFGYSRSEAVGRQLLDLIIPAGSMESFRHEMNSQDVLLGRSAQSIEVNVSRRNGEQFPAELSMASRRAASGWWSLPSITPQIVSTTTIIARDVTQRKEVERMKDEFVGMVSHELKTPLTVIIGGLYTAVQDGVPEAESRQLLKDAVGSAEALAGIVENLLELSRSQSNRLLLDKQRASVQEIAGNVAAKMRNRSDRHQVALDISPGLPRVMADPIRTDRIIHNLVDNAIKYSPDGGRIDICAQLSNGEVVVKVQDRGMGIAMADQARLFQSFERLAAYHQSTIQGIGLGLRVCRILTEAQGGRIWVESEPGKGSAFFFTLPVAR